MARDIIVRHYLTKKQKAYYSALARKTYLRTLRNVLEDWGSQGLLRLSEDEEHTEADEKRLQEMQDEVAK